MSTIHHDFYDALALFSGGLDSILAAKLMQSLGHKVLGLHFVSPFFGHPDRISFWEKEYGIPLLPVDIGEDYVRLLGAWPEHGFGKVLNPCVDCKILMLRHALELLPRYRARFLISGEVLGQRPMSQRKDTLNTIRNAAQVRDVLLRPLSAKLLPETPMEKEGLVNRHRLLAINGRGRQGQFALAEALGITTIPAQAGGCRLAERECARRYWPLLRGPETPSARAFHLANIGRQLWHFQEEAWLCMGRIKDDNEKLAALAEEKDLLLSLAQLPGPLAVLPFLRGPVSTDIVQQAAACLVAFAPKARKETAAVAVTVHSGEHKECIFVEPGTGHGFTEPLSWEDTRTARKACEKKRAVALGRSLER